MENLENIQPVEKVENTESTETLQDTAIEPGERIEETQAFEQAEAVENALGEAVNLVEEGVTETSEDDTLPEHQSCLPDSKDLPEGSGTLGDPDEIVEIAEKLGERGVTDSADVPEGVEFKVAGEDDAIDPNEPEIMDGSNAKEASDGDGNKEGATPINVPGPVTANEGAEFDVAGEDAPLVSNDPEMRDGSEIDGASEGDDKDEATPINLPGPESGQSEVPPLDPVPLPEE